MGFKVYGYKSEPFDEFGDGDRYMVIEGGALEIWHEDGSKFDYQPDARGLGGGRRARAHEPLLPRSPHSLNSASDRQTDPKVGDDHPGLTGPGRVHSGFPRVGSKGRPRLHGAWAEPGCPRCGGGPVAVTSRIWLPPERFASYIAAAAVAIRSSIVS